MIQSYSSQELASATPEAVPDALEKGAIVHFPESPLPFPSPPDLEFLRNELPRHLRRKNISFHPEVGRVVGIAGGRAVREKAARILMDHNAQVRAFLTRTIEPLARGWTVATSSFRPLQEKGRALSAHASNERVHVDAGAYGATHGNRILRFFMNAHPSEDRVWITKGTFPEVYRRYGSAAGVTPPAGGGRDLSEGWSNRTWSRLLDAAARAGFPMAKLADTSPYDRLMRRFHNFMKDSPEFQESPDGHRRFAFPPGSAWMVFTDMVTHACVSGQHAFIDTFIVPRANCRRSALTPYSLLQGVPP
ncbi:MAG: Kdo hydroxylase family protein [Planctomycetes bacterium]|nr:Kdo hydroxylase family protein [Planctomycetota bacterium]